MIKIGSKVKIKTGIKKFNGSIGIVIGKCCHDTHFFIEILGHKESYYRFFCRYEIEGL